MNCSLPGFSDHGILQAGILEWVAISPFQGWLGLNVFLFVHAFLSFEKATKYYYTRQILGVSITVVMWGISLFSITLAPL